MLRCFRRFQRMFRRHRSPLMVKEVNANCEVGSPNFSKQPRFRNLGFDWRRRFSFGKAVNVKQRGTAATLGRFSTSIVVAARALSIVVDAGRFLSVDLGLGLL